MNQTSVFEKLRQAGVDAHNKINAGENPLRVLMGRTNATMLDLWSKTGISPARIGVIQDNVAMASVDEIIQLSDAMGVSVCDWVADVISKPLSVPILRALLHVVQDKDAYPRDRMDALELLEQTILCTKNDITSDQEPMQPAFFDLARTGWFDFKSCPSQRQPVTLHQARMIVESCVNTYTKTVCERFHQVRDFFLYQHADEVFDRPITHSDLIITQEMMVMQIEWLDTAAWMQERLAQALHIASSFNYRMVLTQIEELDRREGLRAQMLAPVADVNRLDI